MPKKPKTQTGTAAIRAHWLDAQRALEDSKPIDDPDYNQARTFEGLGTIRPGQWDGFPHNKMPPRCPIRVLGMKGELIYIVAATGILMPVDRWDFPTIMKLFAPYPNYPFWAWPGFGPSPGRDQDGNPLPPIVKRLERDKCSGCLIAEAGRRGIFDPAERVRGRGGWKTDDESFVWHSGNRLWRVESRKHGDTIEHGLQWGKPDEYMGHFYAQDSGVLEPWSTSVETRDSPAHALWEALMSWNWERKWLDPILFLGWLATAMMGGALDERPIIFVTGGRGSGKSTLHDLAKAIFGRTLFSSANTTAAGIYQKIKHDSRPVMIDELEAKARGDKEQAIIEIARQSYSGAELYRGGQNHDGVEFALRCSFAFSAIIPPVLTVQDRSRMAILNLRPLAGGTEKEPVIGAEWGRMMLRQVMDGWQDFNDTLLPRWRRRLHKAGFDARMIATYGTLLAAAELLIGEFGLVAAGFHDNLGDGKIDDELVIEAIRTDTRSEMIDQVEKWQDVIERILTATIDNWKSGERPTIGQVLQEYEDGLKPGGSGITLGEARRRLEAAGLGLVEANAGKTKGYALAVPRSHPMLDRMFGDTDYRGGNWMAALKQAPEEIAPRRFWGHTIKISKAATYCLLVDIEAYEKRSSGQ